GLDSGFLLASRRELRNPGLRAEAGALGPALQRAARRELGDLGPPLPRRRAGAAPRPGRRGTRDNCRRLAPDRQSPAPPHRRARRKAARRSRPRRAAALVAGPASGALARLRRDRDAEDYSEAGGSVPPGDHREVERVVPGEEVVS